MLWAGFPSLEEFSTVCCDLHKGFGVINKVEIDVFLELSSFLYDPTDVGNLISGSSAFSKSSLNIWKFTVQVLLKPGLENFEHFFASIWDNASNRAVVWACFGFAFLWDWIEKWPFPVLWPLLSFPNCWHVECSTFTASSFRIWNSSTGIPSPPLTLFVVMLPKAHLTLRSRMSGSRWVITPSWLSVSWRSFLYGSSVYSSHLFIISSASVRSIPFPSFIMPIFAWNIPFAWNVSLIFLKRSLVFPFYCFPLFLCIDHWGRLSYLSLLFFGTLHSNKYIFPFLLCLLLLFFSQLLVKSSSDNQFAFLHFFFLGMVLIPASCTMSRTSVHSFSGTLSDLIPWIYFSLPLYNCKGFYLGHTWMI